MSKDYNIIFIVGDGLLTDKLGCYGYYKQTSPTIDRLAGDGLLFKNAFSCSNHTDSSITSMMTGKYPITHGIMHHGNRVEQEEIEIFNNTVKKTLSEALSENGYKTIGFDWLGRWHSRGYDYFGEEGLYPTKEAEMEKKIDAIKESDEAKKRLKILFHRIGFHLPGRSGVYYTRQAIEYIKNNPEDKFFIFIHNWDTHTPFDILPDGYKEKYYDGKGKKKVSEMLKKIQNDKWRDIVKDYHLYGVEYMEEIPALYDAGVNLFDDSIKELIDILKQKGIFKKTIIVITGDHGDNPIYDGIFVGHFGLYDPVIHVPLILYGPNIRKKEINSFVQHIDLYPTLLDLLGIESNKSELNGQSLIPLMEGKQEELREAIIAFDGAARRRFALRTKEYKYIYAPTDNERIIPFDTIGNRFKEELYNLKDDPNERNNLVDVEIDKAKELQKRLLDIIVELEKKRDELIKLHRKSESDKIKSAVKSLKLTR